MGAIDVANDPVPAHAPHLDWAKTAPVVATMPALLAWGAATVGATDLFVADFERITYAEAEARSATFAALLLAQGVGKGTRVGLLLPNGIDFLVSWFAVARIGAVAVPISTLSTPAELVRILRSSGVSLLVATHAVLNLDLGARIERALDLVDSGPIIACAAAPSLRTIWLWSGMAPWASSIAQPLLTPVSSAIVAAAEAQVFPADEVTIVYTSGSTSEPKGVLHSHGNFLRSSRRWCASTAFQRGDRYFGSNPMFWVGGLITSLLVSMHVGATWVSSQARDPGAILDMIEGERCTLIQIWPSLAHTLVQHPSFATRDFSAMRAGTVLAMLPPESHPRNPNPFGFAMGMTETAGPHTLGMAELDDDHRGAMGLLAPGMEHRIVDPDTGVNLPDGEFGELHVRGNTMMLGYVGREPGEIFDQDGWFATGDLCCIRDSHLFFRARLGAMIKTAGANVAPAEVEAALIQADGVAEVHVVGVPDEIRGEIVGALIVPHAGAVLDRQALLATARELLSSYKVPRRVLVVDSIPLTGTNKLDRRAAAKLLENEALAAV